MSTDIKIINDQTECYSIWNSIVDIKTLYDEWDFRLAFYNSTNPLHFITIFDNEAPVALLPLQNNTIKGYYEFWGGNFMENNRIFTKPGFENLRSTIIESLPSRTILRCITPEDLIIQNLPIDDYTYKLNIQDYIDLDSYLAIFNSKHRANMLKTLERINSLQPDFSLNDTGNVAKLISLNQQQHGAESLFNDPEIYNAFFKLLDSKFNITIQSIIHQDAIQSVSFSITHNNTFYVLMAGSNRDFASGIGTYEKLKAFEFAISNKFDYIDFARADCNWKESWKLEKHPLHIFKNFE